MNEIDETMKQIPGFSGYFASQDGRIISLKTGIFKEMKTKKHMNGYYMYNLVSDEGKHVCQTAGRWIMQTFCPNTTGQKMDVSYKDNDTTNNRLDNLEWISHAEALKKRARCHFRPKKQDYKPVYILHDDGAIEKYQSRKDIDFIPSSTLSHLLGESDNTSYGHHTKKYKCFVYYFDQMSEYIKAKVYEWEAERPLV